MTKYLMLLTCIVSLTCIAYEPTHYKTLLEDAHTSLEQQKSLVDIKISLYSKQFTVAELDTRQQEFLDAAQQEFLKQLKIKSAQLEQRIQEMKEKLTTLSSISNKAEQELPSKQLILQQKATCLKDQIDEIVLAEAFIKRQSLLHQQQDTLTQELLSSLNKYWSTKKAQLMSELTAIQAG